MRKTLPLFFTLVLSSTGAFASSEDFSMSLEGEESVPFHSELWRPDSPFKRVRSTTEDFRAKILNLNPMEFSVQLLKDDTWMEIFHLKKELRIRDILRWETLDTNYNSNALCVVLKNYNEEFYCPFMSESLPNEKNGQYRVYRIENSRKFQFQKFNPKTNSWNDLETRIFPKDVLQFCLKTGVENSQFLYKVEDSETVEAVPLEPQFDKSFFEDF